MIDCRLNCLVSGHESQIAEVDELMSARIHHQPRLGQQLMLIDGNVPCVANYPCQARLPRRSLSHSVATEKHENCATDITSAK